MHRALLLCPLVLIALLVGACRTREEAPPPPPPKPATGWTAELGDEVAKTLVDAANSDAWAASFREKQARSPVLEVEASAITDLTRDNLPVEDFQAALQRCIGASDRLLAAAPGSLADARLTAVIGLAKGFYQIDLVILDKKTGDRLWASGIERRRPDPDAPEAPGPAPAGGN